MLAAGTTLGPYQILAPLGAGGMGEVYRAHDSRLGRDVAIKVLAPHLAATPEVRARFEREARTISQLNHPHICTLHDIGHQDGVDYLVMELLEGETLAHRLEKGPLPVAEVLSLGAQIADALDRAHRAGVVHRDLKPGNVMLTKAGAKLMDFGLARATAVAAPAPGALTESPTVSRPLTREGTILGTFQYMAPEQLEGREADARSDLWALGCVLYEMATGKRAFEGDSQASLIAAILEHEPHAMTELRPVTPPALERVVRRCLEKNPDDRLQSARDLVFELDGVSGSVTRAGSSAPGSTSPARKRSWQGAITGFLAGALIVAAATAVLPRFKPVTKPVPVRFTIAPPSGGLAMSGVWTALAAISPDGRAIAFAGSDSNGTSHLWVRRLDEIAPQMIPGTQGARGPIWSPDGRHLAFPADRRLKKTGVDGGDVETLCAAPDMRGATWSDDGTIVFAPSPDGPLFKVPAAGGTPVAVTALDSTRQETAHRFPTFLPDGKHFVFVALPPRLGRFAILVGSVDGMKPRKVLEAAGGAVYAAPGWLVFSRAGRLVAQRFDVRALRPEGQPLALNDSPDFASTWGFPGVSVSRTGVLTYVAWMPPNNEMAWHGLDGRLLGKVPVAPGPYINAVPSPDGLQLAVERSSPDQSEVWRVDGVRGIATRLGDMPGNSGGPLWSPDGKSIMFWSDRNGLDNFYMMDAAGAGPEELVYESPTIKNLRGWPGNHDGVLFEQLVAATGSDLWWLPLHGDRKPVPLVRTRASEGFGFADVSPDGEWLLYDSDMTGRAEVYARPFVGGREVQVTTAGSSAGFWRKNGREILSVSPDGRSVTAIPFEPGSPPRVGAPRKLFTVPEGTDALRYDPSGDRFLLTRSAGRREPSSVTVLLNWTAALKKP